MRNIISLIMYLFGLLYLVVESLISLRFIRLMIALLLLKNKKESVRRWALAQWWAFNVDSACFIFALTHRTVSGVVAERSFHRKDLYYLNGIIDKFSEDGHCLREYIWERSVFSGIINIIRSKGKD